MFIIAPYRRASRGARALARALRGRRYREGDRVSSNDIVINWGDGECRFNQALNNPSAVRLVANKRRAFEMFAANDVPVPRFATSIDAVNWKSPTVVRHKLTGHSGEGIQIVAEGEELPAAPLYVEYKKKEQEYRIHVGIKNGETTIIAVQRKARRSDVPSDRINWQVRNHANGFVFVRSTANPHPSVTEAACDALRASGLDFGAVDVIWNEHERKAYVLEINTAPGLEGTTIEDYAKFFRNRS